MSSIEALEIIDAQIHEPWPGVPLTDEQKPETSAWQVELAREAMDAIGVDMALAVTDEAFINLAHQRYPGRFPGVHTFWHTHPDLGAEVRRIRAHPAMVAGRALIGNFLNAEMRPEFDQGVFDPIYAAAEEVGLPIFNSTHGGCARLAEVAERHPGLTLIVDHIGVAQHPVSPPETMSWRTFPDLLALARYPNVAVKLCGGPLLSEQAYPFEDLWPYYDRLFAAFGFDRVMWGSDYTRPRTADLPRGDRPRKRGLTYAENLNHLLRSDRIGIEDKRWLFGGTARKWLRLPDISPAWGPPPMRW
jgi:L-fuconolactonase